MWVSCEVQLFRSCWQFVGRYVSDSNESLKALTLPVLSAALTSSLSAKSARAWYRGTSSLSLAACNSATVPGAANRLAETNRADWEFAETKRVTRALVEFADRCDRVRGRTTTEGSKCTRRRLPPPEASTRVLSTPFCVSLPHFLSPIPFKCSSLCTSPCPVTISFLPRVSLPLLWLGGDLTVCCGLGFWSLFRPGRHVGRGLTAAAWRGSGGRGSMRRTVEIGVESW